MANPTQPIWISPSGTGMLSNTATPSLTTEYNSPNQKAIGGMTVKAVRTYSAQYQSLDQTVLWESGWAGKTNVNNPPNGIASNGNVSGMVYSNGWLYLVGPTTYGAPASGPNVGSWSIKNIMPTVFADMAVTIVRQGVPQPMLVAAGGSLSGPFANLSGQSFSNRVYTCFQNPDGTLTPWTVASTLPISGGVAAGSICVAYVPTSITGTSITPMLFFTGGATPSTFSTAILANVILPDGSFGSWVTQSSTLTNGHVGHKTFCLQGGAGSNTWLVTTGGWNLPSLDQNFYLQAVNLAAAYAGTPGQMVLSTRIDPTTRPATLNPGIAVSDVGEGFYYDNPTFVVVGGVGTDARSPYNSAEFYTFLTDATATATTLGTIQSASHKTLGLSAPSWPTTATATTTGNVTYARYHAAMAVEAGDAWVYGWGANLDAVGGANAMFTCWVPLTYTDFPTAATQPSHGATLIMGVGNGNTMAAGDIGSTATIVTNNNGTKDVTFALGMAGAPNIVVTALNAAVQNGDRITFLVKFTDSSGNPSPWSYGTTVRIGQAPSVTVSAPDNSSQPTCSFQYVIGNGGAAQQFWRATLEDSGGTVYFDSGVRYDTSNTVQAITPIPPLAFNGQYRWGVLCGSRDVPMTGSYSAANNGAKTYSSYTTFNAAAAPTAPSSVTAADNGSGGLTVTMTMAAATTATLARIYWRRNGLTAWKYLKAWSQAFAASTQYSITLYDELPLNVGIDIALTISNGGAECAMQIVSNKKIAIDDLSPGQWSLALHQMYSGSSTILLLNAMDSTKIPYSVQQATTLMFGATAPVVRYGTGLYRTFKAPVYIPDTTTWNNLLGMVQAAMTGNANIYWRDSYGHVAIIAFDSSVERDLVSPAFQYEVQLTATEILNTYSPQ